MDKAKQAAFIAAAKHNRKAFAKGGVVRRHFADGGATTAAGPASPGGIISNIAPDNSTAQTIGNGVTTLNPLNTQNSFQAGRANTINGTNQQQLANTQQQADQGINRAADFLNGAAGQNGFTNQAGVYNQYANIAAGKGPNPAAAMLNQATGQNVANQAALMAGQRGSSANAGLLARQAAQQGAATQQQAVGQGATMQANQSLAALGAQQNIANNQINQEGQALSGYNTAAQNEQNILQNANSANNANLVGMQSNINNVNGQVSQGNQAANNGMMQGIMNGGALSSVLAKGGLVGVDGKKVSAITFHPRGYTHHYDDGGTVDFDDPGYTAPAASPAGATGGGMAPTDEGAPFKQSGGGGGGGGGSALGLLALLADGGEVNFGNAKYSEAAAAPTANIGSMAATDEAAAFAQPPKKDKKKQGSQPEGSPEAALYDSSHTPPSGVSTDNVQSSLPMAGGQGEGLAGLGTMLAAKGGCACCPKGTSHVANFLARGGMPGGKVPAMVSAKEVYLSPDKVREVVEEGANPIKVGQHFGGKAKVKNDSLKNDTIPTTLEEGGIVIPRHITTHKMAAEKAELFVHRALAKKRMK